MGISIRQIGIVRVVGTTNEYWIAASVVGDNGDAILVFKVDGIVVATVPIFIRDNSGVWSIRKILTTREKTVCVNDFCVTNPIFYEYPNNDTTQPPIPIGGTKMITIKGEKGMSGTVEQVPGSWLWHITGIGDRYYGMPTDTPATYVDAQDKDQMAVIRGTQVYLDQGYSGGVGEKEITISNIDIVSQVMGYTVQIRYPGTGKKPGSDDGGIGTLVLLAIAVGIGLMLFGGKK